LSALELPSPTDIKQRFLRAEPTEDRLAGDLGARRDVVDRQPLAVLADELEHRIEDAPSGFDMTRTLLMAAAGQAERGTVPMDRLELACDLLCRQLLARQLLPPEELSVPVAANEPALVREIVNAVLALGTVGDTSAQ